MSQHLLFVLLVALGCVLAAQSAEGAASRRFDCRAFNNSDDCYYNGDYECMWCGQRCIDIDERESCPPCSAYSDEEQVCINSDTRNYTADNPVQCKWCGPFPNGQGASDRCVTHQRECPPCSGFADPYSCTNASDPRSPDDLNCQWCQGSCKSATDCRSCSSFHSETECVQATNMMLFYPFTCEWCNYACHDNCCAIVDQDTKCSERQVIAGLNGSKIGCADCGGNPHMPNPPPTCQAVGSCYNF